jgi:hypothetical protein
MRAVKDGGLGLTEEQGKELLGICDAGTKAAAKVSVDVKPLKSKVQNPAVLPKEKLPAVFHEPPVPATTAPYNAFVHKSETAEKTSPPLKLNTQFSKTSMQDILPRPSMETGPVDEIREMSLTDFRRLSSNPTEAASRVYQKFINLKEESVVIYLEALAAWRVSPLYSAYVSSAAEALSKSQKLPSVLTDKARIQINEISAIADMNKQLI